MGSKEAPRMKFTLQVDNLELLKEALATQCDGVRFGAEFCEWKIPTLSMLREAYASANDAGKELNLITPRCSDGTLSRITDQLEFLDRKGGTKVIVNDLGLLSILGSYDRLTPYLGRQLIHVPARCPWFKMDSRSVIFFSSLIKRTIVRRHVKDLYDQTSLHYGPTIKFYQENGVRGVDLDWIPKCFSHYKFLVDAGLDLSVHTHLVPVTITRKCHTARFLGEETPRNCSKPCDTRAFLLRHKGVFMSVELFLHGNTVFSLAQPTKKHVNSLLEIGVGELVINMNPATETMSRERADEAISSIKSMSNAK